MIAGMWTKLLKLFCFIRFISGTWTRTCQVIGFGGGYDLGFIRALGGKGTKIVRDFVQQGGSYLGFCAGAYWACNYIEFDKDGPLQVVGERFLKFFQGNVSCVFVKSDMTMQNLERVQKLK